MDGIEESNLLSMHVPDISSKGFVSFMITVSVGNLGVSDGSLDKLSCLRRI